MIKTVIFDYGNVISQTQTGDCAAQMEAMTGVPAQVFRSVYDRFRFEFDRGTITGGQMYSQLLEAEGYHQLAADQQLMDRIARLDMESWRPVHQDVTDWGLSLKTSGLKLGILSNMPTEFLTYYEDEIELFKAAHYACFSCRVGLIKPEPAIYHHVLEGLGVAAQESVFFDDMAVNVEAACALGIHGFVWRGLEQGKRDLQQVIAEHGR